jgi:phenylpropionate dioxygenase-like ring-hydroxylating dioxygenase large terminal subunit
MDPDCVSLREFLGPIWDEWEKREIHTWRRTMANSMWLPCNWKVVLDNFNESYHVPTVHMAATPDTDRKQIRGAINTYFKETKFDLSDEGHNRMIMRGGYGVGATDKEGNILEPLASQLRYWGLDPADFKGQAEKYSRGPAGGETQARTRARLYALRQRP